MKNVWEAVENMLVWVVQVQQIMLAQQQQQQLAAQVAGMRAMAKTNPSSVLAPGGHCTLSSLLMTAIR